MTVQANQYRICGTSYQPSGEHTGYFTENKTTSKHYTGFQMVYDDNPNMLVPYYLMHSYLYYVVGDTIIEDGEYDRICHMLYNQWEDVEHFHKHLCHKDSLTAGTGYHLKYPERVKRAAIKLLEEHNK